MHDRSERARLGARLVNSGRPRLQVVRPGWGENLRTGLAVLHMRLPVLPRNMTLQTFRSVEIEYTRSRVGVLTSLALHILVLSFPMKGYMLVTRPVAPEIVRLELDTTWQPGKLFLPRITPDSPLPSNTPVDVANPSPAAPDALDRKLAAPSEVAQLEAEEVEAPQVIVSAPPAPNHPTQVLLTTFPKPLAPVDSLAVQLPNLVLPPTASAAPEVAANVLIAPDSFRMTFESKLPKLVRPVDSLEKRVTNPLLPSAGAEAPVVEADLELLSLPASSASILNPQFPVPAAPVDANLNAVVPQVTAEASEPGSLASAPEAGAADVLQGSDASRGTPLGGLIALSVSPAPPRPVLEIPRTRLQATINAGPQAGLEVPEVGNFSESEDEIPGSGSNGGYSVPDVLVGGPSVPPLAKPAPVVIGPENWGLAEAKESVAEPPVMAGLLSPRYTPEARIGVSPSDRDGEPSPKQAQRRAEQLLRGVQPGANASAVRGARRVYTTHINMPNLTSASGSWILRFAEMDSTGSITGGGAADGFELEAPVAVRKVDPRYPPAAREEGLEGTVLLYGVIRADGSVGLVMVVRGVHDRLDEYAVEAFRRWRFRPGRKNGRAIPLEVVVEVPFRLRRPL